MDKSEETMGQSCSISAVDRDQPWVSKYRDGLKRSILLTIVGVSLPPILMPLSSSPWISISITYGVLLLLAAISGKRT